MNPEPTIYQARERLVQLAAERRCSLAALSRMIWKFDRYLDRYVREGYPERLPDDVIRNLAAFFDVTERELGKVDAAPEGGARMPIANAMRAQANEILKPIRELCVARSWAWRWDVRPDRGLWKASIKIEGPGEFGTETKAWYGANGHDGVIAVQQAVRYTLDSIAAKDALAARG